jgi:integrase
VPTITKRRVDALMPAPDGDRFLWDDALKGFGLRVKPSGAKSYLIQYRNREGRTRRFTLGKHGVLTPERARQLAQQALAGVVDGRDPAEERSAVRRDLTIAELCDLYLAEGTVTKKPSTISRDRSRIKRHILPLLGRKKLGALERADVERFMRDVANGKTAVDEKTGHRGRAIVTGGRGAATETVVLLSSMLTFAAKRRLRPDNPALGVPLFKRGRRERFLSPAELGKLGETLTEMEAEGANGTALAALRLLMLTGCRKSEILTLRWEWIDFERACLRLPDTKTGARVIPLGAPALQILSDLPRAGAFVLPAERGADGHFVGLQKFWTRARTRAGLPDVRLHDFRHSFASVGVASGDSLYLVGKLLGHAKAETSQRYAHLADDPLRAAADRIAGAIASAMNPAHSSAEVVRLKPTRRAKI